MTPEQRLAEIGIALASVSRPAGSYANAARTGSLLFVSGKASRPSDGRLPKGRLGVDFDTAEGYALARSAATELLAVVADELGSLSAVARVVELQGFLNTAPEFEDHAKVLDGASDLLVAVFGEHGVHARSVVGAASLRAGVPVVLRAVFEVKD